VRARSPPASSAKGRTPRPSRSNREVLPVQRRVLGPEHPSTLTTAYCLAISLSVWRSYIRRNCRYFSFRPSVSALGFGPRVSRPLHLSGIHLKYPSVRTELHNCTQLHNIRITQASCLNCYLLRMQHEARGTFGRNMVEYHMVRGPKPRAEMIE
jgi:hypothetical protein